MDPEFVENCDACLICGAPTKKLHLQIAACYACAAFYRRAVNSKAVYKCRNKLGNCELKKLEKPLCRFCRLKRCQLVGMEVGKQRKYEHELPIVPSSPKQRELASMEIIYEEVKELFKEQSFPRYPKQINYASHFIDCLTGFLSRTKLPNTIVNLYDDNVRLVCIQQFFFEYAKFLSSYRGFSSLPVEDKISLFQRSWYPIRIIHCFFNAIQLYGDDTSDFRVPLDTYQYNDIGHPDTFLKSENTTGRRALLIPMTQKVARLLLEFKKANFTLKELAYMCQTILWTYHEIPYISPATRKLADKIIDDISSDLHDYYLKHLRISTYAARQALILRWIRGLEDLMKSKDELIAAREVFNFGNEKFGYCRFEVNEYRFSNKYDSN